MGTSTSAPSSTNALSCGPTPRLGRVLDLIGTLCPNRLYDEGQRRDWHNATAMMKAYAARYAAEEFEVVALEKTFQGPIVNPATGAASRSFVLAGKVDGIVRIGDDYFLLEHKTAAQLDADYLERLWTDFQITIYAYYVEQAMASPSPASSTTSSSSEAPAEQG